MGLSQLSVWWVQQGIRVEFIEPGHPEQNGIHERMHRTLKYEATRPPERNHAKQQKRFDDWREEFNHKRPHEALEMKRPAEVYERSERKYQGRVGFEYPGYYETRRVRTDGTIKWRGKCRYIGESFCGVRLGLEEAEGGLHIVYAGEMVLGKVSSGSFLRLRPVIELPR